MSKKVIKPINPLIYKTAAQLAAIWYEVGRSQGLTSKFKTAKHYAAANFEKFIPRTISIFLQMLKPTSNCSEHMRQEIYQALIDPINDPNLVDLNAAKKTNSKTIPDIDIEKIIKAYDKNQLKFNDITPTKPNLKDSTILTKPIEPSLLGNKNG